MQPTIGLKELREHLGTYERLVKSGKSFVVMKRLKPIFKITPVDDESSWETVVDFTRIRKNGIDARTLLAHMKRNPRV